MLRDQFSAAASLLAVRNKLEASAHQDRDLLSSANTAPAWLDIPLLNLSLKALVAQQSFSFSRFWRAPPSELPNSMDEELAGWIERVFSQFRNIALTLGWEDPTTAFAFNRPPRMPAIRSGPYCGPQTEGVDLPTSLNDLPEQVRKFAPKKVRNVGSFHPARTALRAAINELEAAKARRNELLQDQARELDLAPERMLTALGGRIGLPPCARSNTTKVLQRSDVMTKAYFFSLWRSRRKDKKAANAPTQLKRRMKV